MVQYYVYMTKKKGCTFLLKRPAQRLIPFEIMNCIKKGNENVSNLIVNRQQRKTSATEQLRRRMKL